MMHKQEIVDWVNALPDNAQVGIDEGGLCLREYVGPGIEDADDQDYLEIGGIPAREGDDKRNGTLHRLANSQEAADENAEFVDPDSAVPVYSRSEWQKYGQSGHTGLGYWKWVHHRISADFG